MIERKVPKDIRNYKTKVLGPFTVRQLICVGVMIVIDIILYMTVYDFFNLTPDSFMYVVFAFDTVIAAFMLEPAGLPMEKYLMKIILPNFTNPKSRKMKNKFYDVSLPRLTDKERNIMEKEHKNRIKADTNLKAYK